MNNIEKLKLDFEEDAAKLVGKIKKEVYNPIRFINMAAESNYYIATKKVILNKIPTDGFIKLLEAGRKDLAIENLVIDVKYKTLFTEEEIHYCKSLLN